MIAKRCPAGNGLTIDEGGTRRSTRSRVRPLEYWRGEAKTYNRTHNSESMLYALPHSGVCRLRAV